MPNARRFAPAVLLAIGVLLVQSAGRQELARLDRPLKTMPATLAGVVGEELQMSDEERKVAGVSDYIFRVFKRDSLSAFSVYVGYYASQATGKTIHSPRNCLPGAGWQIVESGKMAVAPAGKPATVNRYILANGPTQAVVLYWYQGRGRVAHSEYAVKWDLLRDAATVGRTEESLVRVMVPIPPTRAFSSNDWRDRQKMADDLAREVAEELIPQMDRALPSWVPTT